MDLNDTPEQARVPREGARLARGAPRRGARRCAARARSRTRTRSLAARRAWQGKLAEARAGRRHVAEGVRRPGARADRAGHRRPGDRPRRRARHPRRHRRRHARPDDHRPRHRRAEGALPAARCSHGDEVWCQLFSEPAAGLRPRRHPDARQAPGRRHAGVLNGQKVWTTNAQFAAYGLLLARTDPDVPKHKGLTMFIVPMDADGRHDPRPAPDLRRGRVQRGLLRRRAAGRRRGLSAPSTAAGARR